MLLFRSEEEVEDWCRTNGPCIADARHPGLRHRFAAARRGAVVPAAQLLRLARAWYGDRLDPAWRPRTRDESQAIFAAVGLTGDFWELPG